jgi:hypothetical protein
MANHSSTAANAAVRMQHSQEQAVIGGTAAAATGLKESSSCFQLVAGELVSLHLRLAYCFCTLACKQQLP